MLKRNVALGSLARSTPSNRIHQVKVRKSFSENVKIRNSECEGRPSCLVAGQEMLQKIKKTR